MSDASNPVLDFLLTRRSRPAKLLHPPVPDRAEIETLLTAAARVPDHGKLEPWRFVVIEKPALERLAALAAARAAALRLDPDQAQKGISQFAQSPLCVAVIAAPVASDKAPPVEQTLSAGAACLSLLNAALAAGWGANWLTGWPAHDRSFVTEGLGLGTDETLAGFIHIGSCDTAPPDRPRPDLQRLTRWLEG